MARPGPARGTVARVKAYKVRPGLAGGGGAFEVDNDHEPVLLITRDNDRASPHAVLRLQQVRVQSLYILQI